jgi:hypothetical protein
VFCTSPVGPASLCCLLVRYQALFRVRPPREQMTVQELCDCWERNVDPNDKADEVVGKIESFLSK